MHSAENAPEFRPSAQDYDKLDYAAQKTPENTAGAQYEKFKISGRELRCRQPRTIHFICFRFLAARKFKLYYRISKQ